MPISGLDRMPGSGLARGTLFDKELNVTAIDVPTITVRTNIILEADGENKYTITWTQPTGADRILSIPALGGADTFVFLTASQTLTSKTLASPVITGGITSAGSEISFGSAGSGEDVYFYSATSGDHMLWDSSDEKLVIIGTNGVNALEVTDGNVAITDNLTVNGDLTVAGSQTQINTTNLTVIDPLIKLAQATTASPTNDLGIIFTRGNGSSTNIANRAILWDESADIFVFAYTNDEDGETTGNIDIDDYASIRVGAITADDASTFSGGISDSGTIAAGTWNGTAIATSYIANDAITGAKIADNAIDSEHYTDGSIDNAHIADNAIDSDHYTDGSIDNVHLADDAVGADELAANAVVDASVAAGAAIAVSKLALTAGDGLTISTNDMDLDASLTTVTSILNASLVVGRDAHNDIDFTTDNTIRFRAGDEDQLTLTDGALTPSSNAIVDLGTDALEFKDAYFDGTVEADAYTVAGTALNTVIAGVTVANATLAAGATVLETARTIGGVSFNGSAPINLPGVNIAGNQATSGLAATATLASTVTVVDSTDTSSYIAMFDSATGSLAIKTDAGITYNAGTGTLTATAFAGALTGNVTGNTSGTAATVTTAAQTNITSLGTLTALQVDYINANASTLTITDSSDTGDYSSIVTTTHGATTITTVDDDAAAANFLITADGTVDIDSAGVLTLDSGAAINIEPASGSAILLDGTISIDAGVVTGATSITSTAFVGDITGDVTGNASGTAATVTGAAQSAITSLGTLTSVVVANDGNIGSAGDTDAIAISSAGVVTMNQIPVFSAGINVSGGTIAGTIATATQNSITTMTGLVTTSALNSGSIASGFGTISTGNTITTTAKITGGSFDASDGNITNVGDIALDTISSDAGTTVSVTLGTDAGDDFIAGNNSTLVVTGDNDRVGIGNAAPSHALHVAENGEYVARFQQTNTGGGHNHYTIFENDGGGDTFLSFLQASAQGYIGYTDANEFKLLTDGFNARLTIDATSADFTVPTNISATTAVVATVSSSAANTFGSGAGAINIKSTKARVDPGTSQEGPYIAFHQMADPGTRDVGFIGTVAAATYSGTADSTANRDHDMVFGVRASSGGLAEKMRIQYNGNVSVTGALDVGGGYVDGGGNPYDGVVDENGGGNWTTLQAGDDALDAATNTVMLVKAGTYSTLTVDTNNVKIVCEPGTIVTGAIVLSGDHITLTLGAGSDVRGVITLSGDGCSLLCENGVELEGVTSSGDYNMIDGGGWDTRSYVAADQSPILVTASVGTTVQNISCESPSSSSWSSLSLANGRHMALNVRIIESGGNGVSINAASYDCTILNCLILNCDAAGIMSNGPRNKIIGNTVYNAGTYGLQATDTGDNSVFTGNIVEGSAGVSVFVNDSAANVVVVGNRLDGAVTEGSGGTLEAGLNNENTF